MVQQVKESTCNAEDKGVAGSIPGSGICPGERNGNPLQYSRLKKSHGQRSLAGYSPGGHKGSDTIERLNNVLLPTKNLKARFIPLYSELSPVSTWVGENKCAQHSRYGLHPQEALLGETWRRWPCCTEALGDWTNPSMVQRWALTAVPQEDFCSFTISFVFWAPGSLGLEKTGLTSFAVFSSPRNSPRAPSRPWGAPQEDSVTTCCLNVN